MRPALLRRSRHSASFDRRSWSFSARHGRSPTGGLRSSPPERGSYWFDVSRLRVSTNPRLATADRSFEERGGKRLEPARDPVAIITRRSDDQAAESHLFGLRDVIRIGGHHAAGQLDFGRVAPALRALVAKDADELLPTVGAPASRKEAVAVARRAARGDIGVAADHDRHVRSLHRLRIRFDAVPVEELSVER